MCVGKLSGECLYLIFIIQYTGIVLCFALKKDNKEK